MSWKEAFELYFEKQMLGGLFPDLALLRHHARRKHVEQAIAEKEHLSPPGVRHLLPVQPRGGLHHDWMPDADEMEWLSEKYPDTFDQLYRPRWEKLARAARSRAGASSRGAAAAVPGLPDPDGVHRAGRPDQDRCPRAASTTARSSTLCSDGCKWIFEREPEKYVQAWLPVHQIYQGNCFPEGADPTRPASIR